MEEIRGRKRCLVLRDRDKLERLRLQTQAQPISPALISTEISSTEEAF